MTIEKAIEQLEDLIKDRESFCHRDDFDDVFLQDIEALKVGISALEKQMPKKMHLGTAWGVCPTCDRIVETIQFFKPSYCPHCGQAVIWEE